MYSFQSLKVCFIGVGSIASKHINNLVYVCERENIRLTIDAVRRSEGFNQSDAVNSASRNINTVYHDIAELPYDYDVIFITNPTDLHIETLTQCEAHADNFFIEKPVISVAKIDMAEQYVVNTDKKYYIACPMRYTPVLQYIKDNINKDDVIGVRSISSSYLPDWRPGTDYRKCYSAIKALGGGVAIDLIHEWDYLAWLFGCPLKVNSVLAKKSGLEIDTEDYAAYIAEYSDKIIELHLDYFGRKTLREITIFTKDDTIAGDFIENKIIYLKDGRCEKFTSDSASVGRAELRHFLDIIDNKTENDNDMANAIRTLKLTQGTV